MLASDMADGDPKKKQRTSGGTKVGWASSVGLQEDQARKNQGQETECLVVFVVEFNRVCKQIASAGTLHARDGARTQTVAEYCV